MKVKIGKYPSRLNCNVHSNYMRKKYGFDWPSDRNRTQYEKFLEKMEDIIQSIYEPFNRVFFDIRVQKIDVKIDPWDTWSMDSTLGYIVVPMLKQLKKTKHGAPFVEYHDVPEHLRPTQEELDTLDIGETDQHWFARWEWVMDEMIFAFESLHNDWEEQFYSGEVDLVSVPVDKEGNEIAEEDAQLYRLDRGENDTFEIDFEGSKQYRERVNNGFRLFGTYYYGLWD